MTFDIDIKNKIATLTTEDAVAVCGNNDYVISFDFDAEWESFLTKTARFKYGASYTDVVFSGNSCNIPKINDAYGVEIGVYAGDLHTTTPAYLPMIKSITSDAGTPETPSASVYAQLVALLDSKASSNQGVENAGKFWKVAADGSLTFDVGGSSAVYMRVSGGYIQYSTDNETWNNVIAVADLKGDTGDTGPQGPQGPTGANGQNGITPTIGDNGNWYLGGTDTGKPSRGLQGLPGSDGEDGEDGNGIASSVLNADYTLTLTFTDGTSYTTPAIRGEQGAAGANGQNGTNGADGTTFTPSVSSTGVISWTNDGQKQNPQSVDLVAAVIAALPTWTGGSY